MIGFLPCAQDSSDTLLTGFPDSFLLWRHILQSPALQKHHILVAVDLPGYGGSDSLPSYGPYEMLETMTEFILDMRREYLQVDRKVVVATHDWGALVGARLAAEASQLADHWVITSGILVSLMCLTMLLFANASIAIPYHSKCCCKHVTVHKNASYIPALAITFRHIAKCLGSVRSGPVPIQSFVLHLLLSPSQAFQQLLWHFRQLLVPTYNAQAWQRQRQRQASQE